MKKILFATFLVTLVVAVALAQTTQQQGTIQTSRFSREANTNETAAGWRAKLGITGTSGGTGQTNWDFTAITNAPWQTGNANLTNWGQIPTNQLGQKQLGSANLTNWSNLDTNILATKQPASLNLTNWSNVETNILTNYVRIGDLTVTTNFLWERLTNHTSLRSWDWVNPDVFETNTILTYTAPATNTMVRLDLADTWQRESGGGTSADINYFLYLRWTTATGKYGIINLLNGVELPGDLGASFPDDYTSDATLLDSGYVISWQKSYLISMAASSTLTVSNYVINSRNSAPEPTGTNTLHAELSIAKQVTTFGGGVSQTNFYSATNQIAGSNIVGDISVDSITAATMSVDALYGNGANITNIPYLGLSAAARGSVTNAALGAARDATNTLRAEALVGTASVNTAGRAGTVNSIATNYVELFKMMSTNAVGDYPLPYWRVDLPPFNAVGDGVTDDTAAINLAGLYALTNGGTVVLSTGTNSVRYSGSTYLGSPPPTVEPVTFSNSGGDLLMTTGTNYLTGQEVRFTTTGSLPGGISLATSYWLVRITATTYKLATSEANAYVPTVIAYSSSGTPTITLRTQPDANEASIIPFRGTNIAMVGAGVGKSTLRIADNEPASQHLIGAWGKNITFANFTIDGNNTRLGDVVETNGAVLINVATNYTWGAVTPAEGFYVTNMPDEDAITPQYYFENVVIKNMVIKNMANEGVDIDPYSDKAIHPSWMVRVMDTEFQNNYGYAIEAAVATQVERCTFYTNAYVAWPAVNVGSLGNRAREQVNCDPYQSVFRDNFFHGGYGGIGQLGGSNAGTNASYGLIAENNYFFHQTNVSINLGSFVTDRFPSVLRNNHFTITNATGSAIAAGNPGTLIEGGSVWFPAGANRLAVSLSGDGTTLRGMTITNGYVTAGIGRITMELNTISTPGVCIYLPAVTSRYKDIVRNTLIVSATGSHYAPVDAQGAGSATTNPDNIRYLFNTLISSNNAGGGRGLLVTSSNVVIGNHISGSVIYGIQFATGDSNSIVVGNQIYAGSTARVQIDANTFGTHVFSGNQGSQIGDVTVVAMSTKTGNYTLTFADQLVVFNGSSLTATLPTAVGWTGRSFTIKNINATALTVARTSSQTIDGAAADDSLAQYVRATYVSDGTGWIKN